MFWFGIVVTALWLVGIGVGVFFSGKDISTMALNEIGDALAGAFAPIAFLWLFIATWMQRIELSLQREELADTREVLREQREELERAAVESNKQTAIMQRTLEATQSRDVYDEFRLLLYYLAKYISDYNSDRTLWLKKEAPQSYLGMAGQLPADPRQLFYPDQDRRRIVTDHDNRSVDDLFHDMQDKLGLQFEISSEILSDIEDFIVKNHQFEHFLSHIISRMRQIVDSETYKKVPLIVARLEALELNILLERLEAIEAELKAALWPQTTAKEGLGHLAN